MGNMAKCAAIIELYVKTVSRAILFTYINCSIATNYAKQFSKEYS